MTIKRPGWISTYTQKAFYFDKLDPDSICIEDIAHALSNVCRFSGHCPHHYSVAQHSVLVSKLCSQDDALTGLLHDATEAYIGDMVTPLKRLIPDFRSFEDRLWSIIAKKFGAKRVIPQGVHRADLAALSIEAKNLMGVDPKEWGLDEAPNLCDPVPVLTNQEAERIFLREFKNLQSKNTAAFLTAFKPPLMQREEEYPKTFEASYSMGTEERTVEKPKPENILKEADRIVGGDRAAAYGHPKEDFSRTAQIWSAILGFQVPVEKVALCMVGVKISRQCNAAKRDNWVDIAGYAQTGYMVDQKDGRME
jgi:uncharacterized protein